MTNVLFICHKNEHHVHLAFAEAIGADIYEQSYRSLNVLKGWIMPKYDVYLVTSPGNIVLKKILHSDIKIVQFIGSQYYSRFTLGIPKKLNPLERYISKCISNYVDGAMAISTFVKNEASKVLKCPIEISYPFISDNNYSKLLKVRPNLESKKIIFIGYKRPNLRVDILIEAFKRTKKQISDLELYIIGRSHSKKLENIDGVHVTGWVDDIVPYVKESSLAIFPGYGQSFYIGVVETQLAGIPTFVSEFTGAKDAVTNERFIRRMTVDSFVESILWYYNLPLRERKEYSEEVRRNTMNFDKETKCREFKEVFNSLLSEI